MLLGSALSEGLIAKRVYTLYVRGATAVTHRATGLQGLQACHVAMVLLNRAGDAVVFQSLHAGQWRAACQRSPYFGLSLLECAIHFRLPVHLLLGCGQLLLRLRKLSLLRSELLPERCRRALLRLVTRH